MTTLPPFETLVSAEALRTLQQAGTPLVLLDCRFDLAQPAAGETAYAAGHLPGAHYLHLDRDLAGPTRSPEGRFLGRHPLPAREAFAALAGALGIGPGVQVVTYDAQGGPYAARAWWLLHWIGHAPAAVLDGGLAAWVGAGGPLDAAVPPRQLGAPPAGDPTRSRPTVDADALQRGLGRVLLVDARAPERFRGDVEPLDPVAGHIPGALNRPFTANLGPDGRFRDAASLAREWRTLLGGAEASQVVQQCGSGVTAAHNLLAMAHAGLGLSTLYPGSWSEWCSDPARPLARGS